MREEEIFRNQQRIAELKKVPTNNVFRQGSNIASEASLIAVQIKDPDLIQRSRQLVVQVFQDMIPDLKKGSGAYAYSFGKTDQEVLENYIEFHKVSDAGSGVAAQAHEFKIETLEKYLNDLKGSVPSPFATAIQMPDRVAEARQVVETAQKKVAAQQAAARAMASQPKPASAASDQATSAAKPGTNTSSTSSAATRAPGSTPSKPGTSSTAATASTVAPAQPAINFQKLSYEKPEDPVRRTQLRRSIPR